MRYSGTARAHLPTEAIEQPRSARPQAPKLDGARRNLRLQGSTRKRVGEQPRDDESDGGSETELPGNKRDHDTRSVGSKMALSDNTGVLRKVTRNNNEQCLQRCYRFVFSMARALARLKKSEVSCLSWGVSLFAALDTLLLYCVSIIL